MMKTKIFLYSVLFLMFTSFISCENDDDGDNEKPVISNLEVGHDDTIHAGDYLHIEFEVTDNEALDYYNINIHMDDDQKSTLDGWAFDSTFTEIGGWRNSLVHHDVIQVPEEAEAGIYHFLLTMADQAGNTASEEHELVLVHDDDQDDDNHDH